MLGTLYHNTLTNNEINLVGNFISEYPKVNEETKQALGKLNNTLVEAGSNPKSENELKKLIEGIYQENWNNSTDKLYGVLFEKNMNLEKLKHTRSYSLEAKLRYSELRRYGLVSVIELIKTFDGYINKQLKKSILEQISTHYRLEPDSEKITLLGELLFDSNLYKLIGKIGTCNINREVNVNITPDHKTELYEIEITTGEINVTLYQNEKLLELFK